MEELREKSNDLGDLRSRRRLSSFVDGMFIQINKRNHEIKKETEAQTKELVDFYDKAGQNKENFGRRGSLGKLRMKSSQLSIDPEPSHREGKAKMNLKSGDASPKGFFGSGSLTVGPGQSSNSGVSVHFNQNNFMEKETVARIERKRRWIVKQSTDVYKDCRGFPEKHEAVRNLMGLKEIVVNGKKYSVSSKVKQSLPNYKSTLVTPLKMEKPRNKQTIIK